MPGPMADICRLPGTSYLLLGLVERLAGSCVPLGVRLVLPLEPDEPDPVADEPPEAPPLPS
jgi:hypothetical protein